MDNTFDILIPVIYRTGKTKRSAQGWSCGCGSHPYLTFEPYFVEAQRYTVPSTVLMRLAEYQAICEVHLQLESSEKCSYNWVEASGRVIV